MSGDVLKGGRHVDPTRAPGSLPAREACTARRWQAPPCCTWPRSIRKRRSPDGSSITAPTRNAPAAVDGAGFGGHTPLFHTTVTLVIKTDTLARLLLQRGADPNARATFRKALRLNDDFEKESAREYHDITPIGFARQFQEQGWINEAAIRAIEAYGGS